MPAFVRRDDVAPRGQTEAQASNERVREKDVRRIEVRHLIEERAEADVRLEEGGVGIGKRRPLARLDAFGRADAALHRRLHALHEPAAEETRPRGPAPQASALGRGQPAVASRRRTRDSTSRRDRGTRRRSSRPMAAATRPSSRRVRRRFPQRRARTRRSRRRGAGGRREAATTSRIRILRHPRRAFPGEAHRGPHLRSPVFGHGGQPSARYNRQRPKPSSRYRQPDISVIVGAVWKA